MFFMKKGALVILILMLGVISLFVFDFISAESEYSEVSFYTGGMQCDKTATSSSWFNSTSLVRENVTVSGNCSRYSSLPFLPSCCPYDQTCNFETGKCSVENIFMCDQYTNAASCNADDLDVGINSVTNPATCGISSTFTLNTPLGSQTCVNVTSCKCMWNASLNSCLAIKKSDRNCTADGGGSMGYCIWGVSALQDNCNNSFNNIHVTSVATWTSGTISNPSGQLNCISAERDYPCVYTAKLGFITNLSLIIIILLIVLIYYYLTHKIHLKVNRKSLR